MKVLIVKLSAFGDIIHALPALHDVLAHPDIDEVHWLMDSRFAFIAHVLPKSVQVHKIALKGVHPWRESWACVQQLRCKNFDIVIDLQGLVKSGLLAWAIAKRANITNGNGSPFGFDAAQTPEWPNNLFVQCVMFHATETHVVQMYRRIAATALAVSSSPTTLSITIPTNAIAYIPPQITITTAMQQQGYNILRKWGLQSKQFIILHMGGSYATKLLPEKTWHDVVRILLKRQIQPLLLWGNEIEQQRAQKIVHNIPAAIVAAKRLNIETLCGVLHAARAFIGADTGVTHLAAAISCPTITLWGATTFERLGALGASDQHIAEKPSCSPCYKRQCNDIICMKRIKAENIVDKLV